MLAVETPFDGSIRDHRSFTADFAAMNIELFPFRLPEKQKRHFGVVFVLRHRIALQIHLSGRPFSHRQMTLGTPPDRPYMACPILADWRLPPALSRSKPVKKGMIRTQSRRFVPGDAPLLPLWEKGLGDEG